MVAQYSTATSDWQLQNTLQQFFRAVNSSVLEFRVQFLNGCHYLNMNFAAEKAEYFYLVEPANDKSHY